MLPTNYRAVKGRAGSKRACAYPLGGDRCHYLLYYRQEFFSETQFPAFTILGNRGGIKRGLGHHSCPALLLRLLLSRVYVEDGIEISAWGNS